MEVIIQQSQDTLRERNLQLHLDYQFRFQFQKWQDSQNERNLQLHSDYQFRFHIFEKFAKCRLSLQSIYLNFRRKRTKTGNPFKTDHKELKSFIQVLTHFVESYRECGVFDNNYKIATRLLRVANRKLLIHEMYVRRYGTQKTVTFETFLEVYNDYKGPCKEDAKVYEKLMICHCLKEIGQESALDYDFMTSMAGYVEELCWEEML